MDFKRKAAFSRALKGLLLKIEALQCLFYSVVDETYWPSTLILQER